MKNSGATVIEDLVIAARNGNIDKISTLLDSGVNINGYCEVVNSGSIVNSEDCFALLSACSYGQIAAARLLISRGADINLANKSGYTSLQRASYCGDVALVELLLESGANHALQDENGKTALHWACSNNYNSNDVKVVEVLLRHGVSVSIRDNVGNIALHIACSGGGMAAAEIMLKYGADPSVRNKAGNTALHMACKWGEVKMTEILLQHGAAPSLKNQDGNTALHMACAHAEVDVAELLLRHGASHSIRNKDNLTPIEMCLSDTSRSQLQSVLESVVLDSVLKAVSINEKCWNRSKVMLVGQGRAGKSSLSRVILGHAFNSQSPSTCGVDKFEVNVSTGIVEHGQDVECQWHEYNQEGSHLNNALAAMAQEVSAGEPAEPAGMTKNSVGQEPQESADNVLNGQQQRKDVEAPVVDAPNNGSGRDKIDQVEPQRCDKDGTTTGCVSNPVPVSPPAPILPFDISFIAMANVVKDSELLLSLFDFGGQDIFYCVHPFFLTENGAYVVVFDMTEFLEPSAQQECLSYLMFWVNSIAMHTKRGETISDIYIVGTHRDLVSDSNQWVQIGEVLVRTLSASVAWPFVIKEESYIFFPVDCTMGLQDAVPVKLIQSIESRLKESSFVLRKRPLTWFSVLDDLEATGRQQPMISFAEVEAIGRKYSIEMEELISLLRYLREMGVLLWYEDPASLRDAVILDPVAHFVAPVTRIICDPQLHAQEVHIACRNRFPDSVYQTFRNTGVAEIALLEFILSYGGHDAARLMLMMQMYGLLVHWQPVQSKPGCLEGEVKYLLPSLFPSNETKGDGTATDDRRLEICIPHEDLSHWDCSRTFFLVFSLDAGLSKKLLKKHDLSQTCFLPVGIFEQLMCKALVWNQNTPDSRLSNCKLQKRMAEICFGNLRFCMTLRPRHNCIQVDVLGQQAQPVLARLTLHVKEIITRTGYSIFMEPFVPTSRDGADLLISLQSLVGGTCELDGKIVRPESVLRSNSFEWILETQYEQSFDVFLSYRWNDQDAELVLKTFDHLQDYAVGTRKLLVFYDREEFQESDAVRPTLFKSLLQTSVLAPIVSSRALKRLLNHDATRIDNVLFEWITTVLLMRLRSTMPKRIMLERIMPTLLLDDPNSSVHVDIIPHIVKVSPTATVQAVLSCFAEFSLELPPPLTIFANTVTVDEIVTELLGSIYASGDDIADKCLPCRVAARVFNAVRKTKTYAWNQLDIMSLLKGRLEKYRSVFIENQITSEILRSFSLDDHQSLFRDLGLFQNLLDAKLFLDELKKSINRMY